MMIKKLISRYNSMPISAKASIWFIICAFLQKSISVLTTPIFTRLLTTEEYGNYSAFNSWLGIVTVFVTLHMYSSVFQQGLVKFENDKKIYASSMQGLSFVLFLISTIVYLCFSKFWNGLLDLTTCQFLSMLLMIWCSNVFNLWATKQRVDCKYRALVIITLFVSILKPIVGVLLVLNFKDKVTARIIGIMIVELIGYSWLFLHDLYNGKKFYSKKYWIYALKFNIPLIPHYLSQIVLNNTDRIMIKNMVGASEAGIYSVAYSVSMIMTLFNNSLLQTLTPWMYKKIKANKSKEISRVAMSMLISIGFLNVLLIAFAPEVISIFAPKSYTEAIYVIPPVAISVFFMFEFSLFSVFEFYFEKSNMIMIASVLGAILNIILNYIFISKFGYLAAGYTTLICYIAYAIGHYIIMNKICRKKVNSKVYNGKIILLWSVFFVTCSIGLLLTYNYMLIRYSIIIIFVITLLLFRKRLYNYFANILKEYK